MALQAPAGVPTYLTSFVGRLAELALLRRLPAGAIRLATVVGIGGAGKTRLVAEYVRASGLRTQSPRFDRVIWADLSTASAEEDRVALWVATASGISVGSRSEVLPALVRTLGGGSSLLVIDNCEALVPACRELVEALLAACPRLVVLITSRTPLGTDTEQVLRLPPLSSASGDRRSESTDLFYDRASRVLPGYPQQSRDLTVVNRLCERLDGLPLAIELAAPWVRTLTAADLLAEIERSVDLLASQDPALSGRHRSMRAVWNSTWWSLTPEEQHGLSRLSVFREGFTTEAAHAVADADPTVMCALTERALIRPPKAPSSRFGMHEQIRQYAAQMLDDEGAGAAEVTRRRHLDHVLELYERALVDVDTARERRWTPQLRVELSNADAALDWALETGLAELALRLTAALAPVWVGLSGMGAHLSQIEAALGLPWDGACRPAVVARARVLSAAGFAAMQVDKRLALRHFREEVALYDQLGDEVSRARGLSNCGFVTRVDDPEAALHYLRHGLAICERVGEPLGVAWLRLDLGEGLFIAGRDEEAEPLVLDGRRGLRALGVGYGVVTGSLILGHAYRRQHRWREGLQAYATAAKWQQQELISIHGADVLVGLAAIAVAVGRPDRAAWLFGAGRAWEERWGTRSLLDPRRELDVHRRSVPARMADPDWSARYEEGKRLAWDAALQRVSGEVEELLSWLAAPANGLTARELQVLRLVAEGLPDLDVAAELGVSPRTVQGHLYSTYRKLGVGSRSAAVHAARRLGLLEPR